MSRLYSFNVRTLNDQQFNFSQLQGKVVVIVNVASEIGKLDQIKGLELLYQKYHNQGLEIIGFPCNQFKNSEPGDSEDIQQFLVKYFLYYII